VVGIGVNRFNVAILDTELVVDCLEHRHNGVGGAGSRGNDLVFRGDPAVVDAVHDVLQVALARSSQQHLADTVTLEVLGQARLVAPDTGVVHQQCDLDAIGGIIHSARVAGVDELNPVAVGGQRVVLFVDGDGALERTMHRVAAQQTGALGQVVLGTLAHHNRPQTQTITRTGLFNQNACQQTTDATEAIENHITTLALLALATDDTGQLATQEGVQITGALLLELDYQTGQIDGSRAQIQVHQRLDDRVGVVHGQLIVINLASKAMGLEQADYRTVDQRAAINGGDHVIFTIQASDQGNHRLGSRFAISPIVQALLVLGLSHSSSFQVRDLKGADIMLPAARRGNDLTTKAPPRVLASGGRWCQAADLRVL